MEVNPHTGYATRARTGQERRPTGGACRNQRKHAEGVTNVTRGTGGNDTHSESTTRQIKRKRSQSQRMGSGDGEIPYTEHSTQHTVHREAPPARAWQRLRDRQSSHCALPAQRTVSGSPTIFSCLHGKLVKSVICARAAALDQLISAPDPHGREWESSPRQERPWRQRGRPATLPGTGREGRSRQPTEPTDTAAVK
jgi:hypothetical protein